VATPSGITLAPEGGAHQSIGSPLIGISQPGLIAFEPAFADEVAVMLRWAFVHLQAPDGGSVYLRLSTRQLPQPEREMTPALSDAVLAGGYWLVPPEPGAELAIVCAGAVAPEALKALGLVREDIPGAGLLHVTSADRLDADWRRRGRTGTAAGLLAPLAQGAALVTVLDGHPATLSWLGAVLGHRVRALGVDRFGQSADLTDLYRVHGLDAGAILDACAAALLRA
jgi:pyruvate dehydrogenase E1 component